MIDLLTPLYGILTPLGRSYAVATAFSPASLSGLQAWFRADLGVYQGSTSGGTIAVNPGDIVGYWTDQSGNGYNASQSTSANKAVIDTTLINGLPCVGFGGTNWLSFAALTLGGANDLTIYYVGNTPSATTYTWAGLMSQTDSSMFQHFNSDGTYYVDSGTGYVGIASSGSGFGASTATAARAVKSGTTYKYKFGGLTEHTATSSSVTSMDPSCIGTGHGGNAGGGRGSLGEVIVYNRALTSTEMTEVEAYISGRWGIAP